MFYNACGMDQRLEAKNWWRPGVKVGRLCVEHGLPSVLTLTEITGIPATTLHRWYEKKPKALEALIIGAACIYDRQSKQEAHQESDSPSSQ